MEEKIEGLNIWTPEEKEEQLKGVITKLDSDGQFGIQALIKKEDNTEILTPAHKWLQNCIKRLHVGDNVRIVYEGEIPPSIKGQSPTKKYSVYRIK